MKWRGRRGSRNIEDRRRSGGTCAAGVGGIGVIVVVLAGAFFGVDLSPLLDGQGGQKSTGSTQITPQDEAAANFVSVTLADTEEVWADTSATKSDVPKIQQF